MHGRGVAVVIAIVLLAGCTGLPGLDSDAATTASPGTATTTDERSVEGATALPDGESWTVTIVDVIDGDTMEVRYRNGTQETVRLLGVDAPEPRASVTPEEWAGVPDTETGRAWLRTWAENASQFAEQRLAGTEARIVTDEAAGRRGGYGRLLVYIVVDGEVFGEQLLENGYARFYETEFGLSDQFSSAEARAQAADRGVWGFNDE